MQELSLNILDIAENSVRAKATLVEISIGQDTKTGIQTLEIRDNGCGMDQGTLARVTDPFSTSRTTRKVGLGLPLLKMAAEMTQGDFSIQSKPSQGTVVRCSFTMGHIDLSPLGNMGETIAALVQCNPEMDFVYRFSRDENGFVFDTREARKFLDGVPLSEPSVALFIRDYVSQQMAAVSPG